MKHIMHIISSPRGQASFSTRLGKAIIEQLQCSDPLSLVRTHDLTEAPFEHMGQAQLNAFFTRPEERSAAQQAAISASEAAIEALLQADILVISVPVYNFNIHSTLKAWIDQIVRSGRTVQFGAHGPLGLAGNKKVYLAISSKGIYSEGPMQVMDFVTPYLKHILGFIGLTDVTVLRVEGSSVPAEQEILLAKTMQHFPPA